MTIMEQIQCLSDKMTKILIFNNVIYCLVWKPIYIKSTLIGRTPATAVVAPPFPQKTRLPNLNLGADRRRGSIYLTVAVSEIGHFRSRFWRLSFCAKLLKLIFSDSTCSREQNAVYRLSKFQLVQILWDFENGRFSSRRCIFLLPSSLFLLPSYY